MPALKITGGILVFLFGYHMLSGKESHLHSTETQDSENIAISPLAVPLLTGPGTIATTMNYAAKDGFVGIITTISSFSIHF